MRHTTGLLLAACFAQACGTINVRVPVMKPAQINVTRYKQLGVEQITNDHNGSMTGMLKTSLGESNRFVILDRQNLRNVMKEQKLGASEAADSSTGPQLGRTLVASALVLGSIEQQDYKEDVKTYNFQSVNADGKTVNHAVNTRTGKAVIKATLQVTDVETAQIVKVKRFDASRHTSTSATDAQPGPINADQLLEEARESIVREFVEAITPHQVFIETTFYSDGKVPQLEAGAKLVQAGAYEDAITTFTHAIDASEKSGLPSEIIGRAYWNRALAYEYSGQYNPARGDVKKAFSYTNNADFMTELKNIDERERDAKILETQTGAGATADTGAGTAGM